MQRSRSSALALATLALAGTAGAQVVRSGAALDVAGLTPVVNTYRADLGALNPNQPGSFGSGRREINWDGVPDSLSAPNLFPGDFFNGAAVGRARGVVFSSPSGFMNSADSDNPTGTPRDFANFDPSYEQDFEPFSGQRMFTSLDNVMDVRFFIPGSLTPATTRGFGAVFCDVDRDGTTMIEYFDADDNLIAGFDVASSPGSHTYSFLGVSFETAIVARVRITLGNAALGEGVIDSIRGTDPFDVVVTDDFIYAEPVPTPGATALLAVAGVAGVRRRRRD